MGVKQKPVSAKKFGELWDRYLTTRLDLTAQLNLTADLKVQIKALQQDLDYLKVTRTDLQGMLDRESAALARLAKECSEVRRESERRGKLLKVIAEMTNVGA